MQVFGLDDTQYDCQVLEQEDSDDTVVLYDAADRSISHASRALNFILSHSVMNQVVKEARISMS
jgi:hypothetical protein